MKILGHCIDKGSILADPDNQMEPPCSVADLKRFMGLENLMGKFSPNIAEVGKPLLSTNKKHGSWGSEQEVRLYWAKAIAYEMALCDPTARPKVSADVSSFGLEAVLLQENGEGEWRPVAFPYQRLRDAMRKLKEASPEAVRTIS